MLTLQSKIMTGWTDPAKKKRMIEKWELIDEQCKMRGVKAPFDA